MAKYDVAFKLKVIKYRLSTGHSARKAAKKFGIDHGTVQKWCDTYKYHGTTALSKPIRSYTVQFKESAIKKLCVIDDRY